MRTYSLNPKVKGFFNKRTVYQIMMRKLDRTNATRYTKVETYSNTVVAEFDSLVDVEEILNDLCELELSERNNHVGDRHE
ncbi:hypothetical protein NVP3058O_059 [Vibrio phage 3.058.O._10N.286.46.B8]|nr:hypothetical protein NVP3058O_059 [Vibrio phage 3.058.O._10N.286.46.B8]